MTFTDLQNEIAERLNLTSTTALARIGRSINEGYKQIASSIGISLTAERVEGVTATTTINQQTLTFGPTPTPVEKILIVYNKAFTPPFVLDERSVDELRNEVTIGDPAQEYAIESMGADSVTILLNSIPGTQYVLTADVLSNRSTLSGTMKPAFTEDYHNMLLWLAMGIELEKMEKYDKSAVQMKKYEDRMGEYRLYVAVSAYKRIVQGKDQVDQVNGAITPLV